MATDQATAPTKGDAEPEKKKKGKKKLIVILLILVLGGGAAYMTVLKPKPDATAPAPAPEAGAVVPLEPIYINLAQGHYLKLGLALQGSVKAGKELDGSMALDAAISVFSAQDITELSDTKVRAEFKKKLVEQVVEGYEDEVLDVYFTEFVMQ
jgi:flagellar FliL protein